MIKKTIAAGVILSLILSLGTGCFAESVNDTAAAEMGGISINANAVVADSSVYIPLRAACEALGYTVGWKNANGSQTVSAVKNGETVSIDLNTYEISADDHTYYMAGGYTGEGCILQDGHVYMQADLFSEVFGFAVQNDSGAGRIEFRQIVQNPITITTIKMSADNDYIKVNLQYPQISGLSDSAAEKSINDIFRQAAVKAVDEGLQNSYDVMQVHQRYPDSPAQSETYFDYRLKYNQNGLLSVNLLDYQFAGGAHGQTTETSYTFDLSTGKALALSDLMNRDSDYKNLINSAVKIQIDQRIASGNLSQIVGSEFSTIGDSQDYFLSNNGLVIYFQQYEHFPYAAGIQEFSIGYADLNEMFKPDFGFFYEEPTLLDPAVQNTMNVGESGSIVLQGNPTTGYTWHYSVDNSDIVGVSEETYTPDSDLVGAGGTYTWKVGALKKGTAKITFKYYRDWEGESSATLENTVVYQIEVK